MDSILSIYQKYLPNLKPSYLKNEYRTNCPFPDHSDSTPSFFVNSESGQYYCFGCGRGGNLTTFLGDTGRDAGEARQFVSSSTNQNSKTEEIKFLEPISSILIEQLHKNLLSNSKKLEYIIRERCISFFVIKKFLLGYDADSDRFTFPIKSRNGTVKNIKLHNSFKEPKSLSWSKGRGKPRLYPISATLKQQIVICEGEFDCLVAHSLGINAITSTAGVGTWLNEWNGFFTGKEVFILFDSDRAGREADTRLSETFKGITRSTKSVIYPPEYIPNGKKLDITDFVYGGGDLYKLIGIEKKYGK